MTKLRGETYLEPLHASASLGLALLGTSSLGRPGRGGAPFPNPSQKVCAKSF